MQMIIDFVLLAASIAAALYCFILSARLKKLNDTSGGLGASIASMSVTIEQARQILEDTKRINHAGEEKLKLLIEDAERFTPELAELLDALVEAADGAANEITRSREVALSAIRRAATEPMLVARTNRSGVAA